MTQSWRIYELQECKGDLSSPASPLIQVILGDVLNSVISTGLSSLTIGRGVITGHVHECRIVAADDKAFWSEKNHLRFKFKISYFLPFSS